MATSYNTVEGGHDVLTNSNMAPRPWAKLQRNCVKGQGGSCRAACNCVVTASLSLIGHSADVAAVVHALLGQPVIARRLARLLGQSALTAPDCATLIALAALHDLGKINHGFQRKPFFKGVRGGHVAPVVTLLHEGARELQALRELGSLGRLLHVLEDQAIGLVPFDAILAHHGSLPLAGQYNPKIWHADDGYDPVGACRDLVEAVVTWCPEALGRTPLVWNPAFQHAFAGLLMLADWLGSDSVHFDMPGASAPDGVTRFAWAIPVAEDLLRRRGIAPDPARKAASRLPWDCRALIGFPDPSRAQAAMLSLPPPVEGGRTCLIEDETGSGKTEAALIHFLDLFGKGEVDGMYFALPTRAAARQIHHRIQAALKDLLKDAAPHITLAVPGYVTRDFHDAPLPDTSALWAEADAERDALWSSERPKRYLASWVAVGTIDQILMGGLQVRHAQLRSTAMLRLLLVVDEVHASDTYMTTILRNLLDQHRRAGGHALLMSATLGAAARVALLQPKGRTEPGDCMTAVATPYPAVWTDAATEPLSRPFPEGYQKPVKIVLEAGWREPDFIVAMAVAAARQGARVLVIRNTVRDVVATQRALEAVAPELSLTVAGPDGTVRCPHHARYAPEDRTRLDTALEAVLGKHAAAVSGSVTIASQTAEQSLDIDADLLVTDLCPADVLLQRIGRLHRHRRSRPTGFTEAMAIVLAPLEAELAASIVLNGDVRSAPLALGLVYPDMLGIVATRRALAAAAMISVPRDNRRLVETATHPRALQFLAEELGGVFLENWKANAGKKSAQVMAATNSLLSWGEPIKPLPPDEQIVTRLGLNDRTIELPSGTIGPFGGEISLVSVPGRWLGNVAADAEPTIAMVPDGITIELDGRTFIYDRFGLRPA